MLVHSRVITFWSLSTSFRSGLKILFKRQLLQQRSCLKFFLVLSHQQFCETNGVEHIRSPPFHPQSNGQAERLWTLLNVPFPDCLKTFLRCYGTTPNAALSNNVTPAEQMFGRKIRILLDLLRPANDTNDKSRRRNHSMESKCNQQYGSIK